jgi:hypothetical protein
MKKFIHLLSIWLTSCLLMSATFASMPMDSSIAPMLQKVLPAIVNIKAQIKITDYAVLREMERFRVTKCSRSLLA